MPHVIQVSKELAKDLFLESLGKNNILLREDCSFTAKHGVLNIRGVSDVGFPIFADTDFAF